jgi:hypothetical protein
MPRCRPGLGTAKWKHVAAAGFIGWTAYATQAQELDLPNLDLPILLPKWEHDLSLRTGAGYRDNVALASQSPQESAFIATGLEMIFLRLPENNTQFSLYLSADDLRYLSSGPVDKEQTAFAQALVKTDFGSGWQASLAAEYVYQDQVVDVSATEAGLTTIPVLGHTAIVRAGLRRGFANNCWMMVELPVQRQFFHEPLDDYLEYGPRFTLGKTYGHQSELSVRYEISRRRYDHEPLRDTKGLAVPDSHRESTQQDARVTWKHYWDTQRRWRATTKLAVRHSEDNGSGYFDYTKLQAGEQILFRTEAWEISAEAKLAHYNYPIQTVSATDLAKRRSTEWGLNFRCERRLSRFLKIFAEYDRAETISNLALEQYVVNTVKGGLNWTF